MAQQLPSSLLITLCFLTCSLVDTCDCCKKHGEAAEARGMFVFGSSLVDNGNNNFLSNSSTRADYLPYGVDFPSGPSGRFSNGRNPIDILGELLGLPGRVPPFLDPRTSGKRIVHGVNYASGGSGILDRTGPVTGRVVSLNQQITSFERVTLPEMRARLGGNRRLSAELSKYLFVVGAGGNDFLLNYFGANSENVSLQDFTAMLTATLFGQLKKLYGLGARKFVLFSVQAIGCVPVVRAILQPANGSCVEAVNEAAILFNAHLRSLVDDSRQQMPGSHMVYVNSYKVISDIIHGPTQRGFTETSKACCEVSSTDGVLCKRGGRTCGDRDAYVFFDGLHPTDAVNSWIAKKAYGSQFKSEAYPINVKQVALLAVH